MTTGIIVGLTLLIAVLLITVIMMQKPEKEGFIEGMSGASEQHQNIQFKARGFEKIVIRLTYFLGLTLMLVLVVNIAIA